MTRATALLRDLQAAGVVVSADGPTLRLQAAREPPPELIAEARAAKADLLELLRPATASKPMPSPREPRPWSYPRTLPEPGDWCACCKGHRFWTRASSPGWRCWACHPPVPGWQDVRELLT